MKKNLVGFSALSLILVLTLSCSKGIDGPKNPPPIDSFVLSGTNDLSCGKLRLLEAVAKDRSVWSVFFLGDSENPLMIRHEHNMEGKSFTNDYWLDRDMDGRFDEFYRDAYPANTFFAKYPTPCDALKK